MADRNPQQRSPGEPAPDRAEQAAADLASALAGQSENAELQQLRDELEQVKDHALHCAADLENYRKRVAREMSEERRYAHVGLVRDLLPVLDNIQRAIEAAEKSADAASLLQGIKMVGKQLESLLERYHVVRIEALHQPFDPSLHQAIAQQPSAEHPANTVLHVAVPGYQLHDRVVRPSQVVVSAAAGQQAPAPGSDGQEHT